MALTGTERWRLWEAKHGKRTGDRHKPGRRRSISSTKPFVGCDGEGCGVDELGRQNYMLFRIGERELFTGKPLTTVELLDFICEAPKEVILVGFSFGYDITMICRDLPAERRTRLLAPLVTGPGKSRYTYFGDFGIEYLNRNYFRVCRTERGPDGKRRVIEGSSRTIYEVFGFFQMSFLKALKNFSIGADYLDLIERNKEARGTISRIDKETRDYCAKECYLLAELMEKFRLSCETAGIRPRTWNGAGKLAAALHTAHKTLERSAVEILVPHEARVMAAAAYYGGRFEVAKIGAIDGPVYEYDINSAYPAAMRRLPCLEHGEWKKARPETLKRVSPNDLYIADLSFDHSRSDFPLCGLPIRDKHGRIFWPQRGRGIYWSPEITAARKLGARITFKGGWRYIAKCNCTPFDWVEPLYDYRKSIGKKTEGYPIKLGINSLYGKLAQRVGQPKWGNFIWAGLITAYTRAMLIDAVALSPNDIVMLATDGVYSRKPLDLQLGDKLGQWEAAEHARMFVVQPGLYWGPPKPKTRGVPLKFFEQKIADGRTRTDVFEDEWKAYRKADQRNPLGAEFPTGQVDLTLFIGLRLAQARNKPETAGKWIQQTRTISFDWTRKRRFEHKWINGYVTTYPLPGSHDLISVTYSDQVSSGAPKLWDEAREELEDQPDYLDISIPWKE
jgi:hypothetical protein